MFSSFGLWFADFNLMETIKTVFTFQDGIYSQWVLNSLLHSVVSAVGLSLLATAAGYAFAKYEFAGGKALFSIILGWVMIPVTALAIPTYLLFARAQLTDIFWAMVLPSLVRRFGGLPYAGLRRWVPGSLFNRDHRIAGLDRPARSRIPLPATVLAVRTRQWRRQRPDRCSSRPSPHPLCPPQLGRAKGQPIQ